MSDDNVHQLFSLGVRERGAGEPDLDELWRRNFWAQLLVQKIVLMQLLALEASRSVDPPATLAALEVRVRGLLEGAILQDAGGGPESELGAALRRYAFREVAWLFEGIQFPASAASSVPSDGAVLRRYYSVQEVAKLFEGIDFKQKGE